MGKRVYLEEHDNWIREYLPTHTLGETFEEFNRHFNMNVTKSSFRSHVTDYLPDVKSCRLYTPEQTAWLKENYPTLGINETMRLFEQTFGFKRSKNALYNYLNEIGVGMESTYSEAELKWMEENCGKYELGRFVEEFNKRFRKCEADEVDEFTRTASSTALYTYCHRRGWKFFTKKILFTSAELKWLDENYCADESCIDTYKRFCAQFGGKHTFSSMCTCAKNRGINKPQKVYKGGFFVEQRKALGLSSDYYLSDLKNGMYVVLDKPTYNYLVGQNALGKGDVTLAYIDIYLAQQEMKKL